MVYVIIAVVFLMIAAPIVAVLPSKRAKARMLKRRTAMMRGISVEMTSIEDPDLDREKYLSSTGKPLERKLPVAAYRLQRRRAPGREARAATKWIAVAYPGKNRVPITKRWSWLEAVPGDEQDEIKKFLIANLDQLPPDVVKVEEKNNFISAYWQEDGEVQEVIDFLERCAVVWPARIDPEGNLLAGPE